ncbi:hypothetical protein [Desulfurobacterium atlanticum]|uniref:Nickel transport protein n=1 Tax=Desulfurobacterium atlanticum TaxID=240169 RepID=A0A238XTN9_9BACT|nr:hypothetical protein [Desulfurobacterium atlanticum]SNR62355.1 nickel transport protein [Desulfurobacterium atlanticum]
MQHLKSLFIAVLISLSALSVSFAHKISAFTDVEDGKVNVMTYFNDGTPCKNSKVEVIDAKTGKVLLTGKTNADGEFSFTPPKITDLKVVVEAELGHRIESTIPASELSDVEGTADQETDKDIINSQEETDKSFYKENSQVEQTISQQELEKIVNKAVKEAVKKELKPIREEILQIKMALTKPTINEIFGGIGWILGIFGVGAYFSSRNKRNGN